MDELKLLREMHDDVPGVTDAAVNQGREQLLRRMDPERSGAQKAKKKHRRKALRIAVMSVATLGLAAALVAGNVIGVSRPQGLASADAAEVLNNAAELTIKTADPVVGPGQFLKVDSTNLWLSMMGAHNPPDGVGAHGEMEWLDTEKMSLYIPANRDQEWVWERSGRIPTTFFDEKSKEFALNQAKEMGDTSELLKGVGGAFYNSPSSFPDEKDMAAYSRDPRMLLDGIYKRTAGAGQSADGEALVYIADLLRTGMVPADLRAALYKAAALIPGVSVTDNQATLDGQTGIAIGRVEKASDFRQDIIIDPATGQLIGEREVALTDRGSIPAGTAVGWTTIRTTVVDSAP
ncbi:CU044_5270 family protein [Arthrobacter sp. GMC3]|uniref:CU044_5270 family protein n=1 Tax=Arthrobacter sp. GMC3 TaxID=2058894 RepID=UPI000CE44CFD|nr:CU044_5270 family protein [Arthrobacter sp. GMC3]